LALRLEDLPGVAPEPASWPSAAAGSIDLALKFERQLDNFHLEIQWSPRQRRLAILGPSGSGKSLTLKIIAGIESCDRGMTMIDGKNVSAIAPAARGFAYVPQNYGLFPHLTVIEQLQFAPDSDPDLARFWLDRLGLRGLEQRRPAALSLGQQQRVALARALVRPSRLLLLDEPFSALDAPLRANLRQDMLALQGELGAATILVTHDPAEAALLADELLVLEGGRMLQSGPTAEVFARPANELTARLLGAEFVGEGVATEPGAIAVGGGASLKVAGPALQPGARLGWTVPLARVRVSDSGRYEGRIEQVVPVGVGRQIAIRFGDTLVRALAGYSDHGCGSPCRFDIDPDSVRIWPLH
jgi:molybdate transport system permease protein